MVISVAHLLIILLTFKNNIVWLLTISPTDDISVLRIQQYVPCMSILQPTILYSWEKNFKRRAFFLSFIKRLVEILESQKKKLSKNKDFNVGLIYVLPFFLHKGKGEC